MFDSPNTPMQSAAPLSPVFRWVPTILCAGLLLTSVTAQALPQDRQQGAAAVNVADCKAWLGKLASEEFGGRGTGQEGFRLAAEYVSAHFKSLGIEARGED
jgi:hypothetical protein